MRSLMRTGVDASHQSTPDEIIVLLSSSSQFLEPTPLKSIQLQYVATAKLEPRATSHKPHSFR